MRKYTLQELADLTGLTHGYVRDLECLSIDKTPLLETIGKFADALEIDIRQFNFIHIELNLLLNYLYYNKLILLIIVKYFIINFFKFKIFF